ncbi:MAG TPA: cbb3-type cytochrome c oxidase subunit I [Streptosporangiaceae bacterium]|nr:cbb3-type cytochrome c oxidase subunit I [Streptosporangiaceae bacterium]
MTTDEKLLSQPPPAARRAGAVDWLVSTDHKKVGLLLIGTSLILFFVFGALALTMRAQLAQPGQHILTPQVYNEFFTMHGTGMISLVITPFAIGLGVYLIPLQVGAPMIAAPRTALLGYWLYVAGAVALIYGFVSPNGAAVGWWAYIPLSDTIYSPGTGMDLWIAGVFLAAAGMILVSAAVLWTVLRMRAPGMTMMRIPVFAWTMVVTTLMVLAAFPSLLVAMGMLVLTRADPVTFGGSNWNITYAHLFWFYGHPVVYIMFFPFVGCVAEVLSVFSGRKFFGYKGTVLSLLAFAALSMSVWGHHLFTSGQVTNDYYSLTSIMLSVPAGIEYFSMLGTVVGGRLRYPTPMLFAIAFMPQFLIGGLTGIMVATPTIDYHVNNSYFVVAHFHYTLAAGSLFGFFAGFYFWFPKATGVMFDERLGKLHFILMVIGTNVAFLPMFGLGYLGMSRRVASYQASAGFTTLSVISSIGAFILGLAMLVFAYNLYVSRLRRVPAPADPWEGNTLEWATSSPPPLFNFGPSHPIPPIRSYAPLLDLRERASRTKAPR